MVRGGGKVGGVVEGEREEGGDWGVRRGVSSCRRKGRRLSNSTGTGEKLKSVRGFNVGDLD